MAKKTMEYVVSTRKAFSPDWVKAGAFSNPDQAVKEAEKLVQSGAFIEVRVYDPFVANYQFFYPPKRGRNGSQRN